jgi:hypothetical protein
MFGNRGTHLDGIIFGNLLLLIMLVAASVWLHVKCADVRQAFPSRGFHRTDASTLGLVQLTTLCNAL